MKTKIISRKETFLMHWIRSAFWGFTDNRSIIHYWLYNSFKKYNLEFIAFLGGFTCHYLLDSRGVVKFIESSILELVFPSCKPWVKSVLFNYLQFYECYSMAFSKDESPTNSVLQPFVIFLRGITEIAVWIMIKFSGVHVGMMKIIHPKYPDERKTKM